MNINFKKLTMGLITALLFTACGNNETENTKTDNNEEVAQESTT